MRYLLILALCFSLTAQAGGHKRSGSGTHRSGSVSHYKSPRLSAAHHSRSYASGARRDSHGRIKRSESAKKEFMKQTGYPHGRPGYVIDHVKPLSKGGADAPGNMQWQTKADAKAKDKWERR